MMNYCETCPNWGSKLSSMKRSGLQNLLCDLRTKKLIRPGGDSREIASKLIEDFLQLEDCTYTAFARN